MWERNTNHVKAEWEKARKEEAEEQQRLYEEWLRQEVRVGESQARGCFVGRRASRTINSSCTSVR